MRCSSCLVFAPSAFFLLLITKLKLARCASIRYCAGLRLPLCIIVKERVRQERVRQERVSGEGK